MLKKEFAQWIEDKGIKVIKEIWFVYFVYKGNVIATFEWDFDYIKELSLDIKLEIENTINTVDREQWFLENVLYFFKNRFFNPIKIWKRKKLFANNK